jgi:hypothetical protein
MICCIILIISCQTKEVKEEINSLSVKIEHASGDDYSYSVEGFTYDFLPYPLNHAYLINKNDTCDLYILSKRLVVNSTVGIEPFMEMRFMNRYGQKECVVLARTIDEKWNLSGLASENSEMEYLYSVVHMIEYWHSNRKGLNGSQLISKRSVSHEDYEKI